VQWEKLQVDELGAALAKSNPQLQVLTAFLTMLPVAAFVEDKKGRVLFANAPAQTVWKTHNVIGKTITALFENRKLDPVMRRAEKHVLREMAAYVTSNIGENPHFFILLFPVADADGEVLLGGLVVKTHG
jgi:transcriptional regulator of aromatic amino acid metabolism